MGFPRLSINFFPFVIYLSLLEYVSFSNSKLWEKLNSSFTSRKFSIQRIPDSEWFTSLSLISSFIRHFVPYSLELTFIFTSQWSQFELTHSYSIIPFIFEWSRHRSVAHSSMDHLHSHSSFIAKSIRHGVSPRGWRRISPSAATFLALQYRTSIYRLCALFYHLIQLYPSSNTLHVLWWRMRKFAPKLYGFAE